MVSALLPETEPERLAELKRYGVLDTLPEGAYDDLLAIATGICGTPIGSVSLVDAERQWFKSSRGLAERETSRDVAFCAHAILQPHEVMVVPDALADPRFLDNPLVTGAPGIRFYAGAPLIGSGGAAIGTLCVMDNVPRELTPFQIRALASLSRQVVALLELGLAHRELRNHLAEREWYERQLHRHQQELVAENAELSEMSHTDALTRLPNRRAFNAAMDSAIAVSAADGSPLFMAIVDIDHFKAINDQFGHPAGDRALVSVAEALRTLRPAHATVARIGGEEFAVVLPGDSIADARDLCDRMRMAVERLTQEVPLTISIGVAGFRTGDTVSHLYARTDAALYSAKRAGRNRVVVVE